MNVYAELVSWEQAEAKLTALDQSGNLASIILSGGTASVYESDAPTLSPVDVPVLGIYYGLQLLAHNLGGQVSPSNEREYGSSVIQVTDSSPLFVGLPTEQLVWMSHGDRVEQLPTHRALP